MSWEQISRQETKDTLMKALRDFQQQAVAGLVTLGTKEEVSMRKAEWKRALRKHGRRWSQYEYVVSDQESSLLKAGAFRLQRLIGMPMARLYVCSHRLPAFTSCIS